MSYICNNNYKMLKSEQSLAIQSYVPSCLSLCCRDAQERVSKMRTEVESLWSRDVRRLKQAIEHSLEAQRLAESVSTEHASEVREIYLSCCCRHRMANSCAIERCHARKRSQKSFRWLIATSSTCTIYGSAGLTYCQHPSVAQQPLKQSNARDTLEYRRLPSSTSIRVFNNPTCAQYKMRTDTPRRPIVCKLIRLILTDTQAE